MEIALHGYTHNGKDGEFSNLSYEEANSLIKKGLRILNKFKIEVKTFIPPNNQISNDSRKSIYDNGFKIISAGYLNSEYGLTTSTFNSEDNNAEEYTVTLSQCERVLINNETCVIVIHPQDYLTDGKIDDLKYRNYVELLDGLEKMNVTIVNFRDLDLNSSILLG